jgi:hypothetical protein
MYMPFTFFHKGTIFSHKEVVEYLKENMNKLKIKIIYLTCPCYLKVVQLPLLYTPQGSPNIHYKTET